MKKFTILIAFLAFMAVDVFGQTEEVSSLPSMNGLNFIEICDGGTFAISITNTDATHTYNLTRADARALVQSMSGNGGTITFNDVTPPIGVTSYSVFDATDFTPFVNFNTNVVTQPTAPVLTKVPDVEIVSAETTVSASVATIGSGGVSACSDSYEYSTNSGGTWSPYTPGDDISTIGLVGTDVVQIMAIRSDAEGRGCLASNLYTWTVDNTYPIMESVIPDEGLIVLAENEPLILTVDASDDNLFSLEIDHSMESTIPEFTVYASETDPYGGNIADFITAGVTVTFTEIDQVWTIDYGIGVSDMFVLNGGITFYLVLHDMADNKWGSMSPPTPENTFAYDLIRDITDPVLESVTPEEGHIVLAENEPFILVVDASDDNLYSLEIDHSLEASIPEFTVYASETDPYGGDEADFIAAGVTVTYDGTDQVWTINFGTTITPLFVANDITFYLVIHDMADNKWGSMDPTTPENTFAYTLEVDATPPEAPVVTPPEGNVVLALNETFVLTVDTYDENLYSLEIDHSLEGTIPEFTVYASETDPYGGNEADFIAAGVNVTYEGTDQVWTIDFGTTITPLFVANDITFYLVIHDMADNKWGSMSPTTPENTFAYILEVDATPPEAPVVTPPEGNVVLALNETFILTVDTYDENLYSLEIDHSLEGTIPEFTVYASETDPYGGNEADFISAGVIVTYEGTDQVWTIDFGTTITPLFVANDITVYLVIHDMADNKWGSMSPPTDDNTYAYTFGVVDIHNVTQNTYYSTIQAAVDAADPNDVINVSAGTYPEEVIIDRAITLNGAQAGVDPRLGIRTEGDANETIITGDDGARAHGIYILGAEEAHVANVIVDGFEIKDVSYAGVRYDFANTVTLKNTFVHNVGNEGIKTKASCTSLVIKQVISHDNEGDGIELGGYGTNEGHLIEDSWFYNNEDRGIHLAYTNGITVQGVKCYSNLGTTGNFHQGGIISYECFNTTLVDVECYDNEGFGVNFYKENKDDAPGASSSSISGNSKTYNNLKNLSYGAGDGLRVYLSNNVSVTQLESYDNLRQGIRVTSGSYSTQCENNNITDCNVYDNGASAIVFKGDGVDNCTAKNNNLLRGTSTDFVMINTTPSAIDATCNWWGTTNPYEIEALVSGDIDYLPYWSSATGPCNGFGPVVNITRDPDVGYMTIQEAIDDANAGDEITVAEGTYYELLNVHTSVTLIGNDGDPLSTKPIITTSDAITAGPMAFFTVSGTDVTIDNFEIRINRDAAYSGYVYGVYAPVAGTFDGLTISDNLFVQEQDEFVWTNNAIFLGASDYTQGKDEITITNNTITAADPALGLFGKGIRTISCFGTISGNTITAWYPMQHAVPEGGVFNISTNITYGWNEINLPIDGTLTSINVGGNDFYQIPGTNHTLLEIKKNKYNVPINVTDNDFFDFVGVGLLSSQSRDVALTGNRFTPGADAAEFIAVFANTKQHTNGNEPNNYSNSIELFSNSFNGPSNIAFGGIGVLFGDHASGFTPPFADVIIGTDGNENIFNNKLATYIALDPYAGPTNTTIPWSEFWGASEPFPTTMAPVNVDFNASQNVFNGVEPENMDLTQLYALEDKITHEIDYNSLGFITVIDANNYVTLNSYLTGFTSTPSIQRGIEAASTSWTVNVGPGSFDENIDIDKYVKIIGAGSGTGGSLITQTSGGAGDTKVGVLQLSGSGISTTEAILIKDLRIEPDGIAGISVGRFTESTGQNVSFIELENVFVYGTGLNPCTEQERGLYIDFTSTLTNLKIKDCKFNEFSYGWYFHKQVSTETSNVQFISVENTYFEDNLRKAIYAEKLSDIEFTACHFLNNGDAITGCGDTWNAGIDINLKAGDYENFTFDACIITGNAINSEAKEGVGITVKARDDGGTYGSFPATVDNVELLGCTITGNERGIRFGEPGKNNATPTNVTVENCDISGNVQTYTGTNGSAYGGLINMTAGVTIDASPNWWGSNEYADIFDEVNGPVTFITYLLSDDIVPGDPGYETSTGPSTPSDLTVTYTETSQNIIVDFDVNDEDLELKPVPGLDPLDPNYETDVYNLYAALQVALVGGDPTAIQSAALAIGDDILTEYFYMDGGTEVYLETINGNPLVKNKYWQNYLVRNGDDIRYPDWTIPRTLIEAGTGYRTNTNPATGSVSDGWLTDALDNDLYVRLTFISNGNVTIITQSVYIDPGPVENTDTEKTYLTIQAAIDATETNDGHTIEVSAGNYDEDITVNKELIILGPNAGISPNTGTRVAEAIVHPATSDHYGEIIKVQASNVTINGFTINGDNPELTSGFLGTNGADIDAAEAITVYVDNVNNLTVTNNIVQNTFYFGVTIFGASYNAPSSTGHLVDDNLFKDLGTYDEASEIAKWGGGVLIYNDQYTRISNNAMTNVRIGIQTGNFHNANPGDAMYQVIDNNDIQARKRGIFYNLHTGNAVSYTLSNNTITGLAHAEESLWDGILMASLSDASGYALGNIIDGAGLIVPTEGIEVWNVKSDAPAQISGGTISNVDAGILLDNFEGYNSDASNGAHATLSSMAINPNTGGSGIKVFDSPSSTLHEDVILTIGSGVTVTGGEIGLLVENSSASVDGVSDLTFDGQSTYISVLNNLTDIIATGVIFTGETDNFSIEDKVYHTMDDINSGLVTWLASNDYVTINNLGIQRGINVALTGWTVNVDEGTYNYASEGNPTPDGLIKVTKGVTITAKAGSRPIIDGSGFGGVFKIHPSALDNGNTVIIEGFNIVGDATTGIAMTMQGCFDVTPANVIVRDNWFHGMIGGINFWGASNYLPTGWTSGVVNTEITGNKFYDMVAVGTQAFGILIESPVDWTTAGNDYAVKIEDNQFSNLPSSGGDLGTGIAILDAGGAPISANAYISGNSFTDDVPIGIVFANGDVTHTKVVGNSFENSVFGVYADAITNSPLDATCNWWGTEISQEVADMAYGDVQFLPYLVTDTEGITYPWSGTGTYSCNGDGPVTNLTQGKSYMTIQAAVADANPANPDPGGDEIEVDPGIYTEIGQIIIDKNLTIFGNGISSTTVKPDVSTGNSGDARGWWLVNSGIEFNLSEMMLDGNGFDVYQGIRQKGFGTIDQVHFTNIKHPGYAGVAIAAFGNGNVDVTNCEFDEIGRIGVLYFGTGITGSYFTGNTYTGKGVGDWIDYTLDISAGAVVYAEGNTVTANRGVASTDGSTSAGFLATTFFGAGTTAEITDNTLNDNSTAVLVGYDEFDGSIVTVTNNDLSGNDFGVSSEAQLIDAEYNWWGDATGPADAILNPCGLGSAVSENVDFSPWYYEDGMSLTSLNGLPSITLSETPDIDAVVDVPVILTTVVTYNEDVSGYDDAVLEDAYITSDIAFPVNAQVLDIKYNGTPVLALPANIGGVTSLYLSDLLGTAYPLNSESGDPVTWIITFAGFDVEQNYDITFNSVTYFTKTGCNNILATDEFNISFGLASIALDSEIVDVCGPAYTGGFEADMTYPTISNLDDNILTNSLITSNNALPSGTEINWDYNSVASGSYTLGSATMSIYLSTIVGTQYPLQGHSGTDVWLIDIEVPGQASYQLTVQPVAQLEGVDYPYGGSDMVTINYYTSPVADAGDDGATCQSDTYTLAAVASIGTGTWTQIGGSGAAIFAAPNSPTSTVTVNAADTYTFTWTEDNNGCIDSDDVDVEFYPLPTPTISGNNTVCAGSLGELYTTPAVTGNSYLWNVTGGTIASGQGTTSITVDWAEDVIAGVVSVTEYMAVTFCSLTTDYNVTVIALPDPEITGLTNVVTESIETYSTTPGTGLAYTWSVTGGLITDGQNTSSIIVEWPATPGTGTVTVTELNLSTGCIGSSDPLNITISTGGVKVSGNFVYYNSANTPLTGLSLTLMNGSTAAGTTTTDGSGYYEFDNVADGIYTIDVSTTLDPGGMNSLDAGKVNIWFTGPVGIERVKWNSGDVNADDFVNATDAGNIQKYFALGETFERGDWTFWFQGDVSGSNPPTSTNEFTVSGSNVLQNFYGMSVGDFNGNYTPSTMPLGPTSSDLMLTYDGTILVGQEMEFELPIKVTSSLNIAAFSVILDIPSDLISVENVKVKTGDLPAGLLDYGVVGNELRIGWNTLSPIEYTNGDVLFTLRLRTTESFTSNDLIQIALVPDPLNEIGDIDYNSIEDVVLSTNTVTYSPTGLGETELKEGVSIESYPNPFNEFTHLTYSLPVECEVKLEVYNNTGTLLKTIVDGQQQRGEYTVKYNALNINAGVYTVILRVKADDQVVVRRIKLVNNSH